MRRPSFDETGHRVHDYGQLVKRWRGLVRGTGFKLEEFARQESYPVFCVRSASGPLVGGLYISAGIHGDEPAGSEALACWAETYLARHVRRPRATPLMLLPCLNPWGLTHNTRTDHRQRDLNRIFDSQVAPVGGLRRLLKGCRFDLSLHLHEDYDARGIYLYEVSGSKPRWGAELLEACISRQMPLDTRRRIDGWSFRRGLLAERIDPRKIPEVPEALHLLREHTDHVCTFETPSEFALGARVRAHTKLIHACVERVNALAAATS